MLQSNDLQSETTWNAPVVEQMWVYWLIATRELGHLGKCVRSNLMDLDLCYITWEEVKKKIASLCSGLDAARKPKSFYDWVS